MKSQYREAAAAIHSWMMKQGLRPGATLPSSRLLAAQLGFSPKISDRACQELISKGILVRTGYKLFAGAGNPSHPPVGGIVYVVSYWDGFLKLAGRILTERGVHHRAVNLTADMLRNPRSVFKKIFSEKPAGVIYWTPEWMDGMETAFVSEKTPIVICTNGVPPEVNLNVVEMDIHRATQKALRHLHELGHRQIAHVSTPGFVDREIADCYRYICLQMGLKSSASNIWEVDPRDEAVIRGEILRQHKLHPEVTALFAGDRVFDVVESIFKVPKELSVIGLTGSTQTAFQFRDGGEALALWCCTDLISQIQTLESGRPARPKNRVFFVPELIDCGSTRALTRNEQGKMKSDEGERPREPQSPGSSGDSPSQTISPWDSWRRIYPSLNKSRSPRWRQFDLSKLANHSMTREHGWLGSEPLLHFSPGLRPIHGVPFQVINENLNGGRAVVTFRSPRTHSARGEELPIRVKLPVERRVKALYFLHGCGWARSLPFAEYIMHFKNGKTSIIPLVALGPSPQMARNRPGLMKPNIMDWWPLSAPRDFPHAMHAVVFNPADPMEYERYLYTLEWINPRPKDEVGFIEIRVDPKAGPTLALVAVTALV